MATVKRRGNRNLERKAASQNVDAQDVLKQLAAMSNEDKMLAQQIETAISRAVSLKRKEESDTLRDEIAELKKRLNRYEPEEEDGSDDAETEDDEKPDSEDN